MPRHPRHSRGFTLVEMATVVGIIALISVLSWTALGNVRRRGTYTSSTGDVHMLLRQLRSEAFGRGSPTVFVIEPSSGRYWGLEDLGGNFALTGGTPFNPDNPTAQGDRLITSGTLPSLTVQVGPSNGYGGALPAPYQAVPANVACTFCVTAAGGRGAIVFPGGGGAILSDGNVAGGSVTISGQPGGTRNALSIAVVARTGSIQTFERVTP